MTGDILQSSSWAAASPGWPLHFFWPNGVCGGPLWSGNQVPRCRTHSLGSRHGRWPSTVRPASSRTSARVTRD